MRIIQYPRIRLSLFIKIFFLIFFIFILIIKKELFNIKNSLCDPSKPLWWFCPWPGPETICNWNQHFPIINGKNHSPEYYDEYLSSLPKLRSSFEYNNLTLNKCKEKSIDLLIFIISKCSHLSIRQSIRRTWANTKYLEELFPNIKMKLLFLVDFDEKTNHKIELEYLYHNDIVQIINLPEQYQYVTEREAALYQFVNQNCKQTKFIFKTDDDIFINTFLLLLFIKNHLNKFHNKYLLFGFPIDYGLVIRHSNDLVGERYIITKYEYLCSRYPTFLSGFGYLMSFKTSSLFFNAYLTDIKPFPLSDVYFTGLLTEMFHLERKTIFENLNYLYEKKCNEKYFRLRDDSFICTASDDHFNGKEKSNDRNLMNDYNLYWNILIEKYENFIEN